jgi:hypothetical protein
MQQVACWMLEQCPRRLKKIASPTNLSNKLLPIPALVKFRMQVNILTKLIV